MEELVNICGKVCRIISRSDHGPDLVKVDVVTGVKAMRATAGRRPGPQWTPAPGGNPKKWITYKNIIDRGIIVERSALLSEWPVGFEQFGTPIEELDEIIVISMRAAIAAGGVRARRVMPEIRLGSLESTFVRKGTPIPTEEEFRVALSKAWEEAKPKTKKRRSKMSRGKPVIPRQKLPAKPTPEPNIPDELSLPDDKRWSESLNMAVPVGDDGDLMEIACGENGWPISMTEGAGKRKKGEAGFTLSYMKKNSYDAERHGIPKETDVPEPVGMMVGELPT